MDCPDQNVLGLFAEGGLSEEERAPIQSHIDGCADCFTLIVEFAKMGDPMSSDGGEGYDLSESETVGSFDNPAQLISRPRARPADPMELVGHVIDGRYRIDRLIGQGGFAEVYRCHQLSVKRDVAVKVLTANLNEQSEIARRFEAEAQIISRLKHPNVLRLFDFGRMVDGRLYIIVELLDGRPVDNILADGPIEPYRLAQWIKQVCGALQEAHEAGICHRDLKPSNLYLETVNGEDFLKVLDFGIAKIADTKQTTSGIIMGTPSYMSPEQIQAQGVDHRTDLYSLGVIGYEALTGRAPFYGDTPVSVMYKHANQRAPDVRQVRPDIHPAMAYLVSVLLEKEPELRPESAGAVVQFINAIDWSSTDIPPLPPSITEPDMAPVSRASPGDESMGGGSALVRPSGYTPVHASPNASLTGSQSWSGSSSMNAGDSQSGGQPISQSIIMPPKAGGVPWGWLAFGVLAAGIVGWWIAQPKGPADVETSAVQTAPGFTENGLKAPAAPAAPAAKAVVQTPEEVVPSPKDGPVPTTGQPSGVATGAASPSEDTDAPGTSAGATPGGARQAAVDPTASPGGQAPPTLPKTADAQPAAIDGRPKTPGPKKTAPPPLTPSKKATKTPKASARKGVKVRLSISPKRPLYALTDTPKVSIKLVDAEGAPVNHRQSVKWRVNPPGRARVDKSGKIRFVSEGKGQITGCLGQRCASIPFYSESDD
ncbi:MAG: protein kinase [Myxococcota bacterium]|nr:protein kinase [Myxococcota bacterium]